MKKIVITGTIGSGKSYVSERLRKQYNVPVLDIDVAAKTVRDTQAKQQIIDAFGEAIVVNGTIDPKRLAAIVFQDDKKLRRLEQITHPFIYERMQAFFDEHQTAKLLVVEHPLVFELGWESEFDEVWLVTCKQEIAIKRLIAHRGYRYEEAVRILAQQQENSTKMKKVSHVIYNDDEHNVNEQIQKIMKAEGIC